MSDEQSFETLFSYGTLQQESVQRVAFGRTLEGQADVLQGYRVTLIPSEDEEFEKRSGVDKHRNVQFTGGNSDRVPGTVLTITAEELARCDEYEPTDYKRVEVELESGIKAWVYMNGRAPKD